MAISYQVLRRQVAQLFVIRASGHSLDSQREYPLWEIKNSEIKRLLREGIGGVILYGGNVQEIQNRCSTLKQWSTTDLLISADVEEGVGQRFAGASWLIPPMALGKLHLKQPLQAISLAEEYGRCIGNQAYRCGLNWVLGPVCDVNNNESNPVINMRAWGDNVKTVSSLVCAFQRGIASTGVLSCAKHFPGHGDTTKDSHLELPILDHNFSRLNELELIPFKEIVAEGISSVMTSHLYLPQIDDNNPATFSKIILQNILRKSLGFQGLIVTDALIMKAITNNYNSADAAVMAFAAGSDLILMPPNVDEAIEAIVKSLMSGKIPIERLSESLNRRHIQLSKVKKLSHPHENQNTLFDNIIEHENERKFTYKLIENSIEIKKTYTIQADIKNINFIRIDDCLPCLFLSKSSPAISIPSELGFETIVSHSLGISPWSGCSKEPLDLERFREGSFFLQLFQRGNPFKGDQGMNQIWINAVKQLQKAKRLSALIIYGDFYFWQNMVKVLDPQIPSAYSPGQMPLAQKLLLSLFFKTMYANQLNMNHNQAEFTK